MSFFIFLKLSLVSRILQSRIAPKTELHSYILYQNDTKGGEIREKKKTKLVAQHSFVACFGRYFPLLSEKDFSGETSAMFVYLWLHMHAHSGVDI